MAEHIPEWKLERYILGELSRQEMDEIDRLRREDPSIDKSIRSLEESNREILKAYDPGKMAAEIAHRHETSGEEERAPVRPPVKWYRTVLFPAAAVLTAFFIFIFVQPLIITDAPVEGPGTVRLKGMKPGLYVFKSTGDGPELMEKGDAAYAGDLLQLGYIVKDATHGVILSIDGRGIVTLHYPRQNDMSTNITANRKVMLETAYRLDDAPAFERFFMVTSSRPIEVENILRAAKRIAADPEKVKKSALPVSSIFKQYSVIITKGR